MIRHISVVSFEIMIKTATKRAVAAMLSKANVDDEELLTAFCGAEVLKS